MLLLIAQSHSYRIASYLKAAKNLGLKVILASNGEHSLIKELSAGIHIDLSDSSSALKIIQEEIKKNNEAQSIIEPIVGVLGCDDSTVELAALVARQLKLPHNPPSAALLSRRKDLARAHLATTSCSVPRHWLINLVQFMTSPDQHLPESIEFPCVIKPIHLSGSRGVIRANNKANLLTACQRVNDIIHYQASSETATISSESIEQTHALIEEYIDGVEVAFEGYLQDGQLHMITLFDKPDPLIGPYFEETIYATPSQLDDQQQAMVKNRVAQACQAYGLNTGPVHAELRIDDRDAWILEVASRTLGGDCARTLDHDKNFTLEELAISLATGLPVQCPVMQGGRGVMMIPIPKKGILKEVRGVQEARQIPCIEKVDIIILPGHELIPLPEGEQYLGYIFARAESSIEVTEALHKAHEQLEFVISPLWKISQK